MTNSSEHPYVGTLKRNLRRGKIDRREFLRTATLLGLSAGAAYQFANMFGEGAQLVTEARAQSMPKGGIIRIAMQVREVKSPHTFATRPPSNVARQVVENLTVTGPDNVTRPHLLEKWEASADLKSWTLYLRKDVKWRTGRPLVADDVVWNLTRVLDPKTGSSVLGLMRSYMLEQFETGEKDEKGNPKRSTRLWKSDAIQKLDDHTIRLNCKEPQLAVPEHLFHYPLTILDPAENGAFGVGSNGTGPFELIEHNVGMRSVLRARKDYWGEGPYVDRLEFVDLGDDAPAILGALASQQVDGAETLSIEQLQPLKSMAHIQIHSTTTAQTGVARVKLGHKPFDDVRVRMAMKLAIDPVKVNEIALSGTGSVAEHTHVGPMHPDFSPLPELKRDISKAKQLLSEAGFANGIDTEITVRRSPTWELNQVLAMVDQWKEIGVRVKVNVLTSEQWNEIWTKSPFSFTSWAHRPLGVMMMGLAYRTGVPWNESDFSNPEFDKLLSKAEAALDVEQRKSIMKELERILQAEGTIIQPLWTTAFTAYHKKVQGFKLHPSLYIDGNKLAVSA